jgi:hypothetical protein
MLILGIPNLITAIIAFLLILQNFDVLSTLTESSELALTPELLSSMIISILIFSIVLVLDFIILQGIGISVIKETLNFSDTLPSIKIIKNFKDGIKCVILNLFYLGIPMVIFSILYTIIGANLVNNPNLESILIIFTLIYVVLMIFIGILQVVAICNFAKTDSVRESLSISNMYKLAKEIGLLKIFLAILLCNIISEIIIMIGSVISLIPVVGLLVLAFIIYTYIILASYRVYGLIYRERYINDNQQENPNQANVLDIPENEAIKEIESDVSSNNLMNNKEHMDNNSIQRCSKCGYTNPDFVQICINCGNNLK